MLKKRWFEVAPSTETVQKAIPRLLPFLMAVGLATVVFGQHVLSSGFPRFSTEGPTYMAIGGALFLAAFALRGRSLEAGEAPLEEEGGRSSEASFQWGLRERVSVSLAVIGFAFGYTQNDQNTFTPEGVVPWLVGCVALVWGFWRPRWPGSWSLSYLKGDLSWVWVALPLALIVALAAFLRFYQLEDIPRNMTGDHSRDIYYIRDLWERGVHDVYFIPNREPLKLYTVAPPYHRLGLLVPEPESLLCRRRRDQRRRGVPNGERPVWQ